MYSDLYKFSIKRFAFVFLIESCERKCNKIKFLKKGNYIWAKMYSLYWELNLYTICWQKMFINCYSSGYNKKCTFYIYKIVGFSIYKTFKATFQQPNFFYWWLEFTLPQFLYIHDKLF